jgi:hypothetical protein
MYNTSQKGGPLAQVRKKGRRQKNPMNRTQHLDNSPMLIWVISLDPFLSSIVHFTKLTEGKSDIAMADKPKQERDGALSLPKKGGPSDIKMQNKPKSPYQLTEIGAQRRSRFFIGKQNKPKYYHFQFKNQGRSKKQSQNGLPNHEKTKRTQSIIFFNRKLVPAIYPCQRGTCPNRMGKAGIEHRKSSIGILANFPPADYNPDSQTVFLSKKD